MKEESTGKELGSRKEDGVQEMERTEELESVEQFPSVFPRKGWLSRLLTDICRKKGCHDQINLVNSGLSKVSETSCFNTS